MAEGGGRDARAGEGTPAATARPWLRSYPAEVPHEVDIPDIPLQAYLERAARAHPDRTATIFVDTRLSYRRLHEHALRLAAALQDLGVRKGDRVAIMLPNCPQALIAYYGVLFAGGVVVMVNPLYTERELRHQLADAGARHVVALDLVYPKVAAVSADVGVQHVAVTRIADYLRWPLSWLHPLKLRRQGQAVAVPYGARAGGAACVHRFADLLRAPPSRSSPPVDPARDLALLQYTGGTTGLSKGVMLTHRNLVANLAQTAAWLYRAPRGTMTVLAALPFFHVYGLTCVLNYGVSVGATLLLVPRFEVDQVLRLIQRYRPTLFPGAPPMYIAINHHARASRYDLSSIESCISGAAPLPVEVQETFERLTGGRLVEGYGLTEASPVTHCNPLWGRRKAGSIGLPWPSTDCKIVDPQTGEDLPAGREGELAVRGPQVMQGYWNRPDETAQVLKDGWLLTGDIARMDEDGYFYVVDRKKDVIIAGGFNIYPREVEEVLYEHPAILEAAVIGVPDPYRGETVKAFVVLKAGHTLDPADLDAFCRERLAAYKVPRQVEFRAELPKSLAGKVIRRTLREEERARAGRAAG